MWWKQIPAQVLISHSSMWPGCSLQYSIVYLVSNTTQQVLCVALPEPTYKTAELYHNHFKIWLTIQSFIHNSFYWQIHSEQWGCKTVVCNLFNRCYTWMPNSPSWLLCSNQYLLIPMWGASTKSWLLLTSFFNSWASHCPWCCQWLRALTVKKSFQPLYIASESYCSVPSEDVAPFRLWGAEPHCSNGKLSPLLSNQRDFFENM